MPYVLVVDDEEAIRRLLTRWLTGWGYDAKEAANADDAIEIMTAEPADIMLCDVMMPVHDGIWLAEQVRAPLATDGGHHGQQRAGHGNGDADAQAGRGGLRHQALRPRDAAPGLTASQ